MSKMRRTTKWKTLWNKISVVHNNLYGSNIEPNERKKERKEERHDTVVIAAKQPD
jgi:hypothetical protein